MSQSLAKALALKCSDLSETPNHEETLSFSDRAIHIIEQLAEKGILVADALALVLVVKADSFKNLFRFKETLSCCDRALQTLQPFFEAEKFTSDFTYDVKDIQGRALSLKGYALQALGRSSESLLYLDQAIEIYERLVNNGGDRDYVFGLAETLSNKSVSLRQLGKLEEALIYHERSIRLFRQLIKEEDAKTAKCFVRVIEENSDVLEKLGDRNTAAERRQEAEKIRKRFSLT